MIFSITLILLVFSALLLYNQAKKTCLVTKDGLFESLQREYLIPYYLATFSDWLQGPYVYKVYSDYGYREEDIAILFIAGFASSSLFGAAVGHFADKYGRKILCVSFGILYSICCLAKLSPNFYILLIGRFLGGISTSILFSSFEAWYVNEHVNHLNLPGEWLNVTFSKASFSTGLLAILAGIVSQVSAETLNLGSVSPFIVAIPFLLLCSYLISKTWTEHARPHSSPHLTFLSPLYLIFTDKTLLSLGLIQCMSEAAMYSFIFSWTPIISQLNPPYGIVFASFMLAFVIGSNLYGLSLSVKKFPPQLILTFTSGVALVSLSIVTICITIIVNNLTDITALTSYTFLIQTCFVSFIFYELALGLYFPVISFLKSRVVPEQHRASISNWFRVPMNLFTCLSLTLGRINENTFTKVKPSPDSVFRKFHVVFILCSTFSLFTFILSINFWRMYSKRLAREEVLFNSGVLKNKGNEPLLTCEKII